MLYEPQEDNLTEISSTQLEHRQQVQNSLEKRIEEMLQPIFGPGRVIAKVNADIDFPSQKTICREIFDPEKQVVRSEQRSEETSRGVQTLKQARQTPISAMASPDPSPTRTGNRETRTTNYEINREEQQIVANVGDLRRLTVAVTHRRVVRKTEGAWSFVPRKPGGTGKKCGNWFPTLWDSMRSAVTSGSEFGPRSTTTRAASRTHFAEMLADYAERLGKPPLLNALLAFLFLMLVVRPVVLALIRPKVEAGEMVEGLEGLRAPRNSWPFTRLLKRPTGPTRKKSRPVMKMRSWSSRISKQSRPTSSPFGQSHGAGCNPGSGLDETRCGKSINQKLSWLRQGRRECAFPCRFERNPPGPARHQQKGGGAESQAFSA